MAAFGVITEEHVAFAPGRLLTTGYRKDLGSLLTPRPMIQTAPGRRVKGAAEQGRIDKNRIADSLNMGFGLMISLGGLVISRVRWATFFVAMNPKLLAFLFGKIGALI